ncbi:MAG TPA: GNAT family N-acetyltransferase [Thermoanaerobaculia bacterium]|nr:GNAT family N-acetyltransferase [Thermoanaerobaculia bacterium]
MNRRAIDDAISLRTEVAEDHEFLAELYAGTREEELRPVPWSDEEKKAFLRSQFEAQTLHYKEHYHAAEFWIIEKGGEAIGRLYLHHQRTDTRIVDIALVAQHRGSGIGGMLLGRVLGEAAAAGRSVSIHVEAYNPALRLYERLGFRQIGMHGVYYLMEWRPENAAT